MPLYRTGQGEMAATQDLARAIAFIFKHQKNLQVSRRAYSLWGASAGARMAAAIGSHGPDTFGGAVQERPCCVVMLYTGHADYVCQRARHLRRCRGKRPDLAAAGHAPAGQRPGGSRNAGGVLCVLGCGAWFRVGHGVSSGRVDR